jgi:hypothetical protein
VALCSVWNIIARSTGQNDTYPPTPTSGAPSGFNMTIGLGLYGILVAEVSNELTILDYPYSRRNTGRWTGSLGGKVYGGRGSRCIRSLICSGLNHILKLGHVLLKN